MTATIEYHVVAAYDEWVGNFERELTAWLFGAIDFHEDRSSYDKYLSTDWSMLWAHDDEEGDGALQLQIHEEYGPVWQTLGQVDGKDAIVWRLERSPTVAEWALMQERVASFTTFYKSNTPEYISERDLNLRKLTVIKYTIETETETVF